MGSTLSEGEGARAGVQHSIGDEVDLACRVAPGEGGCASRTGKRVDDSRSRAIGHRTGGGDLVVDSTVPSIWEATESDVCIACLADHVVGAVECGIAGAGAGPDGSPWSENAIDDRRSGGSGGAGGIEPCGCAG